MHRQIRLWLSLSLVGCSEIGFDDLAGPQPGRNPLPVEPNEQVDVIVQTQIPRVDILWMIDNSCSMGPEQADLEVNFPRFMTYFLNSGLSYHIGVVSSDMRDPNHQGKLQGANNGDLWITPEMGDQEQIARFGQMAVLGNRGASPEKGLAGVFFSYEEHGDDYNDGFFRDDASLHVIALADEHDFSNQGFNITLPEFVDWFDNLKSRPDERSFSSIDSDQCGASGCGQRYRNATRQIGGVIWNILDTNWFRALDLVGLRASGLKTEYFLSRLPVLDTIEVLVRTPQEDGSMSESDAAPADLDASGQPVEPLNHPLAWVYAPGRNSITFVEFVPSPLSEVEIRYRPAASIQVEEE